MSSFKFNPKAPGELARGAAMGVILKERADAAVAAAKAIAPVESGDYRDGITADIGLDEVRGTLIGRINANDFKSNWVEFGTATGFPAHATLRKAAESVGLRVIGTR